MQIADKVVMIWQRLKRKKKIDQQNELDDV